MDGESVARVKILKMPENFDKNENIYLFYFSFLCLCNDVK